MANASSWADIVDDQMILATTAEGKATKNRLHLDIEPVERTLAEEVERLVALGARVLDD